MPLIIPLLTKNGSKTDETSVIDELARRIKSDFEKEGKKVSNEEIHKGILMGIKSLKSKSKISSMDEFINFYGSKISGDLNHSKMGIGTGESTPTTTDQFAKLTAQGPRFYNNMGYGTYGNGRSRINEYSSLKMKELMEVIVTNKKDKDIVDKYKDDYEVSKTSIPDISEIKIKYHKPIILRKLNHLIEMMSGEVVSGEESAIILNHILDNINLSDINGDYKKILMDKLNG